MMSPADRLVYMANQIARNFGALHQRRASEAVADHIRMYWDPRMRGQIDALLDEDGSQLSEVARSAIEMLRHGAPAHQTGGTTFNAVDEAGRSDAG